jgi:hypothetical protein
MSIASRLSTHIRQATADRSQQAQACGQWFNVRLQPDMLSGEQINIGVAFVDERGTVHTRFTQDVSGLRCLYGERIDLDEMDFLVRLAAENYDRRGLAQIKRISPHLSLGTPTFAAGESASAVLDVFFHETVALGQHNLADKIKRAGRFSTTSTENVRHDVFAWLRQNRPPVAQRVIARDTRFKIRTDERGMTREHVVELPLRAEGKLAGSIVSAYMSSTEKAELRILQAGITLNTVVRHLRDEKCGLFIYRPGPESGLPLDVLNRFDDLIDENVWKLRDAGVYVGVESTIATLGHEIASWAALPASGRM